MNFTEPFREYSDRELISISEYILGMLLTSLLQQITRILSLFYEFIVEVDTNIHGNCYYPEFTELFLVNWNNPFIYQFDFNSNYYN